nr:tetratricopeptide repeat protein [Candidatus Sigynarchaeota archaeon]
MDSKTLWEIKQTFSTGQKAFKYGNFESALESFQDVFNRFRDLGNSEGMAESLYQVAQAQQKLGHLQDAAMSLKEALELFRFLKKKEREVISLHALGMIHAELGDDELALKYFEDALAIYQEKDYKDGIGSIYFEMGNLALNDDDLANAVIFYQKALSVFGESGNEPGIAKLHYMLALATFKEEDIEAMRPHLEKAGELFEQQFDVDGRVKVRTMEGLIALKERDTNKAELIFKDCMRLIAERYIREPQKSGVVDKQSEVQILMYMGTLLLQDSKYNLPDFGKTLNIKAYEYFNEAGTLSEKIQYKKGICQAFFSMGLILFERGTRASLDEATAKFSKVLDIAKEIKDNELIVKSLLFLGISHRHLDKIDQALNFLQDCTIISRKLKYASLETRSLIEKFKIFFKIGKLNDALSMLETAMEITKQNKDLRGLEAEVLVLLSSYHQVTGDLHKAGELLAESHQIYEALNNKKGLVNVLTEMVTLNERQGFTTQAISCLSKIEAIHRDANRFTDMSRAKIEIARLIFETGDVERAIAKLKEEIDFIRDAGINDGDALIAEAKFILFKILKHKNETIESDEIFADVLNYYSKNDKLLELFDVFIDIAYESMESGNAGSLKHAIEKLWKIVSGAKETVDYNERLIFFLHIFGIIHQQDGALDLARKYFNECLVIIQKLNTESKKGVILAQLGDLSLIEGKADALSLFTDALKIMSEEGQLDDTIKVHVKIAEIMNDQGNIEEAIEHAMQAVKTFEDASIVHNRQEVARKLKRRYKFYTQPLDAYALLGSLYISRFTKENDPTSLERALISTEFQKLQWIHSKYYAKQMFSMYSCQSLEKYVEADETLGQKAVMKHKLLEFLVENRDVQIRLLAAPDSKKDFVKKAIDFLNQKIAEERLGLVDLVQEVKKNRAYLMECKDPGSYVPFIGFNLVRQAQKVLKNYGEIAVIDYALLPLASKIAIFIMHQEDTELILSDAPAAFFTALEQLNEAIQQDKQADVIFLHRKLTDWLFPVQLKERLLELGVAYPFICPDPRLHDITFDLLGEENNLCLDFTFFYLQSALSLKSVLQGGREASPGSSLDFYFLFPDPDDAKGDELADLVNFFDRKTSATEATAPSHLLLQGADANHQSLQDIVSVKPAIIHFSGTSFLPASLPFKGFLNMNDRAFFLEDFMELDLDNKHGLICLAARDEVPVNLEQAFFAWKTLSLSNIPNFIFMLSKYGFSGRIFSFLYDRLLKGDTLGQAFHNCMIYFNKIQEISPLARESHILIGNPFWKLKNKSS